MMMRLDNFFVEEMQKNGFDVDFKRLKQIYLDSRNRHQGIVRSVDRFLQRKLGVGLPNEWLERAGLKEPSKKAPQRPQERFKEQHDELDGPSL